MKKFSAYFRFQIRTMIIFDSIFLVFIFLVLWLMFEADILTAFILSTGFTILTLPFMLLDPVLNEYSLKKGVKSKGFEPLLKEGFRLIEHRKMPLLTGEYSGFHFDIYFSPLADNISTFGLRGYGGYVFIVYFEPIPYRKELQLYDKYYDHPFKTYTLHWSEKYVRMESQNGLFPSHKKIKKRMDMLVAILLKEGIVPRSKGLQA